jgi:prepilin-type N-terminal cleavage/methylation domain-containing protein
MKTSFYPWIKRIIRRFTGEAGMSLAETLVAIAILGVSAAAFITALSTGSIAVNTQDEGVTAQGLAQTQMEVIKAAAYDSDKCTVRIYRIYCYELCYL